MKRAIIWLVLNYLRIFAKIALSINKPFTIGIAGSAGKSSTRNAIFSILKDHFKTKMVYGNSETGLPLGILGLEIKNYSVSNWLYILALCPFKIGALSGCKYLVVEMGIDDPYPPKNMEYLLSILKPDLGICLNVAATHTMQFEKLLTDKQKDQDDFDFLLTKIAEEDTKMIRESEAKIGIYNQDDKYLRDVLKNFNGTKLLTFGESKRNAIFYKDYTATLEGTKFTFGIKNTNLSLEFKNALLPKVYQEVLGASILAIVTLGLKPSQIKESLEKNFTLPKGRSSIFLGIRNTTIIDSSYNSSKNSVLSFLDLVSEIKKRDGKEIAFLMGDMRELGNQAEKEHKEVARKINLVVDYLYCVGPLTQKYVIPEIDKNKIKEASWFTTSFEAGKYLWDNLPKDSILLVKGSQNEIFLEEAIKEILLSPEDVKKLCRQEKYWMDLKKNFILTS